MQKRENLTEHGDYPKLEIAHIIMLRYKIGKSGYAFKIKGPCLGGLNVNCQMYINV